MKSFFAVLCACASLFLAGCLQVDSLLLVRPDGSGTLTQTVVMSHASMEQVSALATGIGAKADAPAKVFSLLDENRLKETAAKMGEGVSLVSSQKITNEFGQGYTAVFAFKDINELKLDQGLSSVVPELGGSVKKGKPENAKFTFAKAQGNEPAKLVVSLGKDKPPGEKKDDKKDKKDEIAGQMLQQFLKDMKLGLKLEVQGQIVSTNAEHVNGNRITLAQIDFNQLLANPVKLQEVLKHGQNLHENKAILKTLPGVLVETKTSVGVSFK